jgi:hypothetical protein
MIFGRRNRKGINSSMKENLLFTNNTKSSERGTGRRVT